jgi:hypothetical protein
MSPGCANLFKFWAALRDFGERLAVHRGVGSCATVAGVVAGTAVEHWIPGVGEVVAVQLIVLVVSEERVVADARLLTSTPSLCSA